MAWGGDGNLRYADSHTFIKYLYEVICTEFWNVAESKQFNVEAILNPLFMPSPVHHQNAPLA